MISLDDIRVCTAALPDVAEKTHFGRPAFRVRDKLFVSVHLDADEHTAILGVDEEAAKAAVAGDSGVFEEVWRSHGQRRIFVGLQVDLAAVPAVRFRELVEHAWRNKAPKRLVAVYDAPG